MAFKELPLCNAEDAYVLVDAGRTQEVPARRKLNAGRVVCHPLEDLSLWVGLVQIPKRYVLRVRTDSHKLALIVPENVKAPSGAVINALKSKKKKMSLFFGD